MAISNKKWLILLLKLIAVLLLASLVFLSIAYAIIGGEPTFDDTYQSVIQRKYDKLKNIEGNKIIILGGSNASFGINATQMERAIDMPVANMALHIGFGQMFNTEIGKSHIQEGDIVLLAYEYDYTTFHVDKLGDINLIMSGIDTKLEMYKEIPLKNLPEIFGNLFEYAKYKASKDSTAYGVYSSGGFDEEGDMTFKREASALTDYQHFKRTFGEIFGDALVPPDDVIRYLSDFRNYVEQKGAKVYLIGSVILDEAYNGTEQQLLDFAAEIEERTGIPYISDPLDYLFPNEYMFDQIYHCNDLGQYFRTERLLSDLYAYGILEQPAE